MLNHFDLKGFDIIPAADPQATSQQERLSKAMAPLELIPLGTIDVHEATIRVLQAQDQPNWEKLIPGLVETGKPAPPPPDPKAQEMQMKMQAIQQGAEVKAKSAEHKAQLDSMSAQGKLAMQAQESVIKVETQKALANAKLQEQVHNQKIFMADSLAKVGANQVGHTQEVVHNEQQHRQKMQHNEESQKSKLLLLKIDI